MKLLIFSPVYNCEKQIPRVVKQMHNIDLGYEFEHLIVDNCSQDNTVESARNALNEFSVPGRVLKNSSNYSLGGSHKVAFDYALDNSFSHLIVLHGDDQAQIQDILPFLKSGEAFEYDCYLGARFHPQSRLEGYSQFRIFGNKVLNAFCSLVSGVSVYDMGAGLNMYNRSFMANKNIKNFPDDLTFNVYLLFYSFFIASKVKFFPLVWREEDQVSNAKVMRQGFKILGLLLKYIFNRKALFNTDLRPKAINYKAVEV